MTIQLSPQIEKAIQQKIDSGLYSSANEVLAEALNAMEIQDQLRLIKLGKLRQDIADGLDSESSPWDFEKFKKTVRERKPV
jgi:antitoxin ParD1/3/4